MQLTRENSQTDILHRKTKSGMDCYLLPMNGYEEKMAAIVVKNGGNFAMSRGQNGVEQSFPAGTAHFIEHKLFRQRWGDAFASFHKQGAWANAFTDAQKTVYYFSCQDHFMENLRLLLSFVQNPYFLPDEVEKEKSIIQSEINMYQDSPDWAAYYQLLGAMYHVHPVQEPILGTEESLQKITKQALQKAYDDMYATDDFSLVCVGDFSVNKIMQATDIMKPRKKNASAVFPAEPKGIVCGYKEKRMGISQPIFQIGFKMTASGGDMARNKDAARRKAVVGFVLELLAGESSEFSEQAIQKNYLDEPLSSTYYNGDGYAFSMFTGKGEHAKEVAKLLLEHADSMRNNGILEEDFRRIQKKMVGEYIRGSQSITGLGFGQIEGAMTGTSSAEWFRILKSIKPDEIEKTLQNEWLEDTMCISVIR